VSALTVQCVFVSASIRVHDRKRVCLCMQICVFYVRVSSLVSVCVWVCFFMCVFMWGCFFTCACVCMCVCLLLFVCMLHRAGCVGDGARGSVRRSVKRSLVWLVRGVCRLKGGGAAPYLTAPVNYAWEVRQEYLSRGRWEELPCNSEVHLYCKRWELRHMDSCFFFMSLIIIYIYIYIYIGCKSSALKMLNVKMVISKIFLYM